MVRYGSRYQTKEKAIAMKTLEDLFRDKDLKNHIKINVFNTEYGGADQMMMMMMMSCPHLQKGGQI